MDIFISMMVQIGNNAIIKYMKKLLLIGLFLISICSFGQRMHWGENTIHYTTHDTAFLADTDTLETINLIMPNENFTWVYGINYGEIDSTTTLLYIQASIPTMGWVSITDTITIDSTSTDRVYYLTGDKPKYEDIKFVMERDTVEDIIEGWIKDIFYIRESN